MNFNKINNIVGWIVCLIACTVYIMTMEASASFWDCGEFISSAFKVQVPHPPGAPMFILLARLFTLPFPPAHAASGVNLLSALASGFTILFLFWTITHFARRLLVKNGESISTEKMIAIMGAGIVGALAYTFTDSFWFSAVEGEVYGCSSFFTALVFWAILKWEHEADTPQADRWIVFIAYMMGLSIGVHLLNLLTIPAIVMVYYFRKYKASTKGTIWAFILGCLITGAVQIGVIQYTVKLAGGFDLFFVNSLGLPFNSGSYFFIALLATLILLGLRWARKKGHYFFHLGLWCFAFLLLGYSTYFTTLIRSNANPAIDMYNVDNPMSLVGYLDREQYGDFPLFYGPVFTAEPTGIVEKGNKYARGEKKYEVVGKKFDYKYNDDDMMLFPRVWDASNDQGHADFYRSWLGLSQGQKPSFADNLNFFFTYQVGFMYMRYFMWNFSGRQNDTQGFGNVRDGNWITGIPFIDNALYGDQSAMPDSLKNNKAHNKLYLLPFILGIIGLVYQFNRHRKDFLVNFLLFFFTGMAIVLYLNQAGNQPRERDYAYVGSFYAFAIWIGLGVLSVYEYLKSKMEGKIAAVVGGVACLLAVPVVMGFTEWDDHDRSLKLLARDVAADYLESCAPNAILFTVGDNDTYPLWYVQEVEGIRPDIRVINLSLLGVDWYIDQLRNKINQSDPVPMSWTPDKYHGSNRDYIRFFDAGKIPQDKYFDLNEVMAFVGSDDPDAKLATSSGESMNYLPTRKLFIPVDIPAVVKNGTVKITDSAKLSPRVEFDLPKTTLFKNDLLVLNIIAANKWQRPIYFTSPVDFGLNDYLQVDGLTYRLVPLKKEKDNSGMGSDGRVNTEFMYNTLMTKFRFGGAERKGNYFDEPNRKMLMGIRNAFARLGIALAEQGRKEEALKALDHCDKMILEENFPYALTSPGNFHNINSMQTVYAYYLAGNAKKADEIAQKIIKDCEQQLTYYGVLSGSKLAPLQDDQQRAMAIISQLQNMRKQFSTVDTTRQNEMNKILKSSPVSRSLDSGK